MKDKQIRIAFALFFVFSLAILIVWIANRTAYPYLIVGDGVSYYAYLPSWFFDQNIDLSAQYEYAHSAGYIINGWPFELTATGLAPNVFEVGPAILWLPFYLVAFVASNLMPYSWSPGTDMGFGVYPFEVSVILATFLYGWAGIILTYKTCLKVGITKAIAFWAVILTWLGSSFLYYQMFLGSVAHGVSVFATALFLYFVVTTEYDSSLARWFLLGLASGIMVLSYTSHVFVVMPILVFIGLTTLHNQRFSTEWRRLSLISAVILAGFVIAFAPQLGVWHILYGSVFPPERAGGYDWLSPRFFTNFVSTRHGLVLWNPIVAMSLVGVFFLAKKSYRVAVLILVGLAGMSYINGSVLETWDHSFGARRFVGGIPMFMVGLAGLLHYGYKMNKLMLWTGFMLAVIFVGWNFLFLVQFTTGCIPPDQSLIFQQIFVQKIEIVMKLVLDQQIGCH